MNRLLFKSALAVGLGAASVAAPFTATPAFAQTTEAQKIGIVNIDAVVANSNAYKTAEQQRETTYASQIAQAKSRQKSLEAQLKTMVASYKAEAAKPKPNQTVLEQKREQIQAFQQKAQAELQQIMRPVALSRAYVEEQVRDKLQQAIETAAKAAKVNLVLSPDNVVYATPQYNLNQAVLDQINSLIPSAQLIPPQGWLPRQARQQQQAEQAAQAGEPAKPKVPVTTLPKGR